MSKRLWVLLTLFAVALALLGARITPSWQVFSGATSFRSTAHVQGLVTLETGVAYGAHVVVIRSNGVGAVGNVEVLSGLRSLYLLECLDEDGCTVQLGEAGVPVGQLSRLVNISTSGSANHNLTFGDSGAMHLAGAFTGTSFDVLTLIYVSNRSGDGNWYEVSRSTN